MTTSLPALSLNASLRWDALQDLLPDNAEDVLEIGCGQGAVTTRLARRYPRLVALEPDDEAARVARGRVPRNVDLRVVRAEALDPEETFDLICAFEVLEHLADDRRAVNEWERHLRPGGVMVLSVPAWSHRMGSHDVLVGHYRRYSPGNLTRLLAEVGLDEVVVRTYGGPGGYVLEAARNVLASRRSRATTESMEARTSQSGRYLQPRGLTAERLVRCAATPLVWGQRRFPGRGTGLVAAARRSLGS